MPFAVGSKYQLGYIAESTYGTTPGSPSMTAMRITGDDLNLTKESFLSNELRADREIVDFRHGNKQVGGGLNFELAFDTSFDDFFLALLGASSWSNAATITGTGIAFVNGTPDTITDTGNGFVTAGFEVGDKVTVSGAGSGSNSGLTVTLTAVAAGTLTISETTVVNQSAGGSVTLTASRKFAKVGTTVKSFSLERQFTDITKYQQIVGARVNSLALSVQPNAIVTGNFGILAKGWTNSSSSLDSSLTAAGTNSVFDSFSGTILENGSSIATVTGLELNVNNNLGPAFVVGSSELQQIFEERCNVSGQITAFLDDITLLDKFANETVSSLEFKLTDGTNYYTFIVPRLKYSDAAAPINAFGGVVVTLPFQGYRDPTVGASLRIEKSS